MSWPAASSGLRRWGAGRAAGLPTTPGQQSAPHDDAGERCRTGQARRSRKRVPTCGQPMSGERLRHRVIPAEPPEESQPAWRPALLVAPPRSAWPATLPLQDEQSRAAPSRHRRRSRQPPNREVCIQAKQHELISQAAGASSCAVPTADVGHAGAHAQAALQLFLSALGTALFPFPEIVEELTKRICVGFVRKRPSRRTKRHQVVSYDKQ